MRLNRTLLCTNFSKRGYLHNLFKPFLVNLEMYFKMTLSSVFGHKLFVKLLAKSLD